MFSAVGRVAAIGIYSLILAIAGCTEFANAHPESETGCCEVSSDERSACSAGGKLNEESCLRSKCCFDRTAGDEETTCYQPKQSCVRCAMKVWKRKPCGYWSSGRAMCESLGCCYDGRMFPYCYSAKTEMLPATIAPRDDPGVILNSNGKGGMYWDSAAEDKMVFDPNKKEITLLHCPVNHYRTACGPIGIDKAQCSQLGCCWNPALGNPVCFQTVSQTVNNQTQVDAVNRELEKQTSSSSSTSSEEGGSNEDQVDAQPEENSSPLTHYNYGNFTVILECPVHANASGPCQAGKRNLCMEQSCCWIDGVCVAGNSRFQQTGGTSGTPGRGTTISDKPLSDQAFLANYWIRAHVEVTIEDIDMQLMCSTVNSSALPCGEENVTREECVKMRCCWDPEFALHNRPESVCSMPALTKREPSTENKGSDEKSKSSWSNWQSWSDCMPAKRGTPLGGKSLRRRDCTSRDAEYAGVQSCSGAATETMDCIDPGGCILGDWSSWTQWSKCSESCSPGMQARLRRCELEEAADIDPECKDCGQGLPPSYGETDERKCNEMLCPKWEDWKEEECVCGKKTSSRNCSDPDVAMEDHDSSCYNVSSDCPGLCPPTWSDWGEWTQCSGSCERGMRTRSRRCTDMDDNERTGCGGNSSEAEECNSDLCVKWSDWQMQDDCDAFCNETGTQSFRRTCINPPGFVGEDNACHTRFSSCDGEVCRIDSDTWSSWSSCQEDCGPSFMTRNRICIINGVSVDPSRCKRSVKEEKKICNERMCESWAEWRTEDDCNAPCRGTGNRTRTRKCLNQNQTSIAEEHSLSCYSLLVPCDGPPMCPPAWSDWGSWSSCSENCTVGVRERKRACVAENGDAADNSCSGEAEQTETCNTDSCLQWSEWSPIGECDSECEEAGVQSMERTCLNPADFVSADIACNAKLESCTGGRCMGDWNEWTPWSDCPSSCGPSTTSRARQCMFEGGATDDLTRCHRTANATTEQSTSCNEHMCKNWGQWMPQDDCTAPCKGAGLRTLFRSCMDANRTDDTLSDFHDLSCFRTSEECKGAPVCPPEWGDWSEWTTCSQTCEQGIRSRKRGCYSDNGEVAEGCDGLSNQTENCNSDLCLEWGAWEVSGDCFAVCEQEGTQLSLRKCMNPADLEPVASECNTKHVSCTGARCLGSWGGWGDWSDCKDPCGPSTISRTRECIFQGNATEDISRCLEDGSPSNLDTQQCNMELCTFWGDWGLEDDCNAPCRDLGNQTRSRPCLDAAVVDVTIAHKPSCYMTQVPCDGPPRCPPAWRPWEEWSPCSTSCQQGSRMRIRTCIDEDGKEVDECTGDKSQTQPCNNNLCVTWNDWQITSQCDADCEEGGHQDSQRTCADPAEFVPTSEECFTRRVSCNGSRCMGEWDNWSNWSDCKNMCGPASMNRLRRCIFRGNATEDFTRCERDEGDSSEEVASCNEHLCSSWGEWTLEDDCDAPCRGTGIQTRSRPCLEDLPALLLSEYHEASCYRVEVPCDGEPRCPAAWAGWEEWSSCSEECTQGLKTRTRLCLNDDGNSVDECTGMPNETTVCNSDLCDLWGPWKDAGPCNASCEEYGVQNTKRSCLAPADLIAGNETCYIKHVSCLSGRCMGDWGGWGAWSVCPDPCGPSQTNRSRSCVFKGETTGDLSRCQRDGETEDVENGGCNEMMCSNWGDWNLQDDCNAPCRGTGNQTEWRTCLDELTTDIGDLHATQCYTITVACLGEPTCPPAWSEWGEWSSCSETCAKGERTRERSCEDDFGSLTSGCTGGAMDTEDCNIELCHEWGDWELVGGCEAKCEEEGLQWTKRTCLNPPGFINDGSQCGANFSACTGSRCMGDWSDWNRWSECRDSCAPSLKNRTRRCVFQAEETDDLTRCMEAGEASDVESAACNELLCKSWGEWGLEGNCNASCRDVGFETRSRACLDGDSQLPAHRGSCYKELVQCEGASICPPAWSRWESWSECSETCTIGSRQRNRACLNDSSSVVDSRECLGAESETESCNGDLCEEWGTWETTGDCLANCEEVGAEELWRSCLNPVGLTTEDPLCNTSSLPCRGERCLGDWNKWSSWSDCSDSCSRSTKTRTRECLFRGVRTVDTTRCHRDGIVANVDSAPCNEKMCEEWGDWMLEDDCDASCKDTGIQTRSRPCLDLNTTLLAAVYLNHESCFRKRVLCSGSPVCPPAWEDWGSWGSCSDSCSPGLRSRSRSCFNDTGDIVVGGCDGVATETEDCNSELCQEWSEWEEVGSCSAGCEEDGEQRSERRCISPSGFKTTNTECDSMFTPCRGERCMGAWDDWSPWSNCDSKCEPSVVNRTRICMFNGGSTDDMTRCQQDDQDSNIDHTECNQFLCKRWGDWRLQNDCDAPCRGKGKQTSARECLDEEFSPKDDLSLHEESCYSFLVECEGSPICPPSWQEWGSWSTCSESCIIGSQTRSRVCTNDTGSAVDECLGDFEETQGCNTDLCAQLRDWETSGDCNASCEESGWQKMTRGCLSSPELAVGVECGVKLVSCDGERCMGEWDSWGAWSDCQDACGPSLTIRTRSCVFRGVTTDDVTRCDGDGTETASCNENMCKTWGDWRLQNDCDALCRSQGKQTSARDCLDEEFSPKDDLSLHEESCYRVLVECEGSPICPPSWQEWGSWSTCSESCIIGSQTRSRVCTNDTGSAVDECLGDFEQTRGCNTDLCAQLSDWETSGDCNASCEESGWQKMTRGCLSSPELAVGVECGVKLVSCDGERCMGEWDSWGAWSDCQDSCGPSLTDRTRRCVFRGVTTDDVTRCDGDGTETAPCNENMCKRWGDWRLQNDCDAPCRGQGTQTNARQCLDEEISPKKDLSLHEESCYSVLVECEGSPICPPSWQEWGSWSTCSESCIIGSQTRSRVCTNDTGSAVDECPGELEETQGCNTDLCAQLSDWETSGDCNASCEESGWQKMTRGCLSSPELAVGVECGVKFVSCDGKKCMGEWDSWGAWSDCQDSCGPSLTDRTRRCVFRGVTTDDVTRCDGDGTETASCNENMCKTWGDWILMDDCDAPCRGDGSQTRSRQCMDSSLSEPLPDLHSESCFTLRVPCTGEPTCPPAWEDWGPWSSCSQKCTAGGRSRSRSCVDDDGEQAESCQGNGIETDICNSDLCLDWGDWVAVGECEAKCEMEGMRRSERLCKDPVGFVETNAECNVKRIPCIGPRCMGQWDVWSTWSDCFSSCGPSFMNRTRKCIYQGESTEDLTRCHSLHDTTNVETIGCNEFMCHSWGEWRLADDCDAPCRGFGLQTRHRPCLSDDFAEADDLLVHQLSCFSERVECEGAPICPPSWSGWGNWSVCSESCTNGERIRSRACTDDRGKVVSSCDGEEVETETCNTDLCLAWGEYQLVGECSASCEQNGTHKAERKCLDPIDFVESKADCFERSLPCSGRRCSGDWEEWGSWSRCSDICGPSEMSRRRRCVFKGEATDDLTRCQAEGDNANMETATCNERLCKNWAEWNLLECDAACRGKGIQTRSRACLDEGAADLSAHEQTCYSIDIECQGAPTCPPRWGEYGNWSACSESCSRGMAVRDRPCLSEFGDVLGSGCEGSSTDVKLCNEDLCVEWGDWELVTQCDALCEKDGQERYERSCASPDGFVASQEACNVMYKPCKGDLCKGDWSAWGEWSECHERCGPSNNTRTRDCVVKGEIHEDLSRCYRGDEASNATDVRLCNQELCHSWNEWCLKEDCSAPCRGKGLQTRSRNCSVVNEADEVVYLNLGEHEESCYFTQLPCEGPPTCPPSWNDWGAWSPCSQSCSVGVTSRRRQCATEFGDVIDDDGCEGASTEDARCNDHLCRVWSDWALAVACDGDCEEEGLSWTLRTCKNQTVHHQTDPVCYQIKNPCVGPPCPGSWGPWGAWSACGERCGPSERNRSRSCFLKGELAEKDRCTEGESDQVSPCNVIYCSSWMGWKEGNCTGVCGVKGSLKRERGCLLNQNSRVIGSDLKTTFPGMPEDCYATTKVCIPECVPEWSKWSQWSSCSSSCSPGSRIRSRKCLFNSTTVEPKFCSQAIKKLILSDEFSDDGALHNAPCNLDLCLTWSQWSGVCSSGCGEPGIMVKRRQCKFGLAGQNIIAVTNNGIAKCSTEQVPCLGKCLTFWSPWSSYSSCTRTCGPGRSVSRRYCYSRGRKVDEKLCGNRDISDPDDESSFIRSRVCNTDVCDSWTSWSGLKCSRECGGGGRRHKRRICNGTGEVRPITKPLTDLSCFNVIEVCGDDPCPAEYTAWLPWTRCSSVCGRGTRRRWRSCRGLNGLRVRTSDCSKFGPSSKRERCSLSGCVTWASWEDGECSASCGRSGTLLRKRKCTVESVPPVENPFERCYNVTRPCRGSCG